MLLPAAVAETEHSMAIHSRSSLDALLVAYERYQRSARGLCEITIRQYSGDVRRFLRAVVGKDPIDVRRLRASQVVAYVSCHAKSTSPRTAQGVGASLKSFFRFLRAEGICGTRLDEAVPRVPCWRLSALPRGLGEKEHARLLASLGTSTPRLLRDRAMILCLSTLGLRAGEVAGLRLDDIDWRAGTIRVASRKTRRGALLPLPRAAARAIVAYLRRGRPRTRARHVFVRHHLGVGEPISSLVVTNAVGKALDRARIDAPHRGANVLRHTLATRMVCHGASMKEVADVLGHRSLDTTRIYAKVDVPSLSRVALPWPGVVS
jgi:site-specific recombinase XerD